MTTTAVVLVVLVLCVLYLAFRVHQLTAVVATLAHIVDKPRRRDHAIREEIAELEAELAETRDEIAEGYLPDEHDFQRAEEIREKLDRRLRALAGRRRPSEPPPAPSTPPTPPTP
jgi:hypothetical protein